MKKILLIITAILIAISISACGGEIENGETQNPETQLPSESETPESQLPPESETPESELPSESETPENIEGSLNDIINEIYEKASLSEGFREFIESGLAITEIKQGESEYFFGTNDIEFKEAIASEPLMTASAYSLCLLRLNSEENVEEIKQTIKNKVNPQKWICVGVSRENVIVDNIGDLVVLIMTDSEPEALHKAFLELAQ